MRHSNYGTTTDTVTLSIAQLQTLALKTMGFREDHEVTITKSLEDGNVTLDIFHVRVVIEYDGSWGAYSRDIDGDSEHLLGKGVMPRLGMCSDGEPYPL